MQCIGFGCTAQITLGMERAQCCSSGTSLRSVRVCRLKAASTNPAYSLRSSSLGSFRMSQLCEHKASSTAERTLCPAISSMRFLPKTCLISSSCHAQDSLRRCLQVSLAKSQSLDSHSLKTRILPQ